MLESVIYLGSHLSYRESQEALRLGRIELSLGQCEQKHHGYAACYERACKTQLKQQAEKGLAAGGGRDWVLEIDGMFVMERDKPFKGRCERREVKQSVLYPRGAPHERHYLTQAGDLDAFATLNHGLQRQQGVKQHDRLIGIADGAPWIDRLFDDLGVAVRILDVFHAGHYLDTVMQALGWDEHKRSAERASWCRADVDARIWLKHYLPDPELWLSWPEAAQSALRYLEERLDQMDYFAFKQQGLPIGSGVIEGAANSVIAARMRRSGMRWSHSGINRMATLRAEYASYQPILDFHPTRLLAFP